MDIIVLKFGGSSVANNEKLRKVAEKILQKITKYKILVVVSAQGKTTDHLLEDASELANIPSERELASLLSCGEQLASSKLSILLNDLGCSAISLTGWQAGILTSNSYQNAIIEYINPSKIKQEFLTHDVVIVAGFQGYNRKGEITTLGRGGSDTTALALAAALSAKHCIIYSDVDGIYTSDPNRIEKARKLKELSYKEMMNMSNEGAKVLHNRSVQIAEKFSIPIIAQSTFKEGIGTTVTRENRREQN